MLSKLRESEEFVLFAEIISTISNLLYSYILIVLLLGAGIYFSIRTRFVQFRMFVESLRVVAQPGNDKNGLSSFQALMVSTASRVGTGNIAGISTAICLGGVDGDIFLAALRREERLARARAACNDSLVAALEAAGRRYMTQPAAWYRFNRLVLRYSAAADRWIVVGEAPQAARAGAALTGDGTTLYWLGGELKPGVRTPEAWRIDLP